MKKPRMTTADGVQDNVALIASLFPDCMTEIKDSNGNVRHAVDFDKLRQNLSEDVVEGSTERYQFTWPGKREAMHLANTPIRKTLRPCREESVGRDGTPGGFDSENLYIEGDNLDVLKCLREDYLGAVKMIYIDPPYNTGKDFVYRDNYAKDKEEFEKESGYTDEEGNKVVDPMVRNTEANGRFHTDWLNMMYPRLKVARDLLSDDGVIVISLDDNEQSNLLKTSVELFGQNNFIAQIPILSNPRGRQSCEFVAQTHEYILVFSKHRNSCIISGEDLTEAQKKEYKYSDTKGLYRLLGLRLRGGRCTAEEAPSLHFPIYYDITKNELYLKRINADDFEIIPKFEDGRLGTWRWSKDKIERDKNLLEVRKVKDRYDVFTKDYLTPDKRMKLKSLWAEKEINYDNSSRELSALNLSDIFDYAKPLYLMTKIIKTMAANKDSIILDFFSGSATTAHAVMKLNAEDGGHRKFIMVQFPELTDKTSEAYKAGYKNICEIGKERIRRAGNKIRNEKLGIRNGDAMRNYESGMRNEGDAAIPNLDSIPNSSLHIPNSNLTPNSTGLDIGFRVLKLDSSNMQNVYYTPEETPRDNLLALVDNIKADRTGEDLLFQAMLELNIELSAPIRSEKTGGKNVFVVDDGYLVACFDDKVDEAAITEIAKMQPQYFVMRDASAASDDVLDSFEQIFRYYSPGTVCKLL